MENSFQLMISFITDHHPKKKITKKISCSITNLTKPNLVNQI